MRKTLALIVGILFFMTGTAFAVDATLNWEASSDSIGYKIFKSLDLGVTWDDGIDVGNVTTYLYTNIEETGLVIFRVSAYNTAGETVTYWSGAWFNYLWLPPLSAQGLGLGQVG
ncbi:unnamed protein product [marine sediment metagenome]|uniref:Fibronectin type-III domain-containing protein n=1 Tax=marine sediment metagenome TaxID=412755 RepID=X0TCD8_9ZZZZ